MSALNLSTNGPSITKSYQSIVNSGLPSGAAAASATYGQWAVFTVAAPLVSAFQQDSGKESVLKVQSTGEGELVDLIDEFQDGRIQFAFLKVKDPNTTLPKFVLIGWCGEGVPERTKGYFTSHLAAVSKLLHGYHIQITARSDRDLTPEGIIQKVSDASGAKYSGGPTPGTSAAPRPPVASKPVFTPTQVGGGGGFNPLGSRSRAAPQDTNTDADGWGADAPPVTRTQLEKVAPAYKPTKVNIKELASQTQEPSRFTPSQTTSPSDVVRGGYQPIGKVDIAAIRRQAKESGGLQDDRPTVVKGAYEPIGKVDIAAIRARAQGPAEVQPVPSNEEDAPPKSLAERSTAFSQPERLTTMPKPKVANKFAGSSTFTGTKAPAPVGLQGKPAVSAPQVGLASKTFADEGGKTPAQLWAEKKAREGGNSGAGLTSPPGSITSPLSGQKSGDSGSGWKSGYTGKSWAPVQTTRTGQSVASNNSQQNAGHEETHEEETNAPAGGVGAIRDRFKGAAPIGVHQVSEARAPSPPAMDLSSKPNAGARGVPMPGLPTRPPPAEKEVPEEEYVHVPPPPRQPRSPSPETPAEMRSSSPIRVALPVGRGADHDQSTLEPAEELHAPPPMPTSSISQAVAAVKDIEPEHKVQDHEPARAAAEAAAASTFGAEAVSAAHALSGGKRALVQYDYEKAEDNELELREGEYVTNIDMVDEDWWMGENERGETGLFPSNYVELVEDEPAPAAPQVAPASVTAPPPAPPTAAAPTKGGATATALYDYDAAEDNELSFPDGATIHDVEFPDEDWWFGHYGGKSGLFPANYVQIND